MITGADTGAGAALLVGEERRSRERDRVRADIMVRSGTR